MKSFFSETQSPKMNAILKCAIFFILFAFFIIIRKVISKYVIGYTYDRLFSSIIGPLLTLFAVSIMLKMEKKTFADYGLFWERDTPLKLLKGIGFGLLIYSFSLLTMALFTESTFVLNNYKWHTTLLFSYLSLLPLAFIEEIAFRGYPFIKLNKVFGLRSTQLIIAIAFAFFHILQGWSFFSAFISTAIIAYLYGLSAVWSKGIAMPTGMHSVFNLCFQLFGLNAKPENQLFILRLPDNASPTAIARVTQVGIITQLSILLIAIILTEYFIRKKQTNTI